jgi:phage terminase large subunit
MKIQATINLHRIEETYNAGQRGIVLVGGTRSSKTISALQWILLYCMRNTGKRIVIGRDSLVNLRRTILEDFKAICYGYDGFSAMFPNMHLNKQDMTTTFNGNTIVFVGLKDDPMRVHGLKSDVFFINECVNVPKITFDNLEQRCRDFWLVDLNPSEPNSYVYKLEMRDEVTQFRSTYLDNPFLTPQQVKKIESYCDTEDNRRQGTADPRKWSIYGLGETYKGKEIIYPNWNTYSGEDPEGYDYIFYGLDWGFNDALAVIKLIIVDNDLYIREIIYGSEIDDFQDVINKLMLETQLSEQRTYLVCDSSEPRSIITLQKAGLPAMKTKKGQGSILDGIRKVNGYNLLVHEDSKNVQNEFNNYKFKIDDRTDTILDIPVDKDNHACDAIRYPLITFL